MNTLDDLRSTLRREADFDDTGSNARPLAVQARVRTTRRRRAGVVSASAVVVLVAAVALTGALRGTGTPQPTEPTLGDVDVPQQISVYGFPYELSDTRRAAADGTVALPDEGDGPFAVSLVATGLGSGQATLWSGLVPVARVRGGDQVSAPVDPNVLDELRVELDGTPDQARAEVAVYLPTGALAPGVASDGVVFRQRYGDRELVDAAFATAGGEASVDVPVGTDLDVSAYCSSATPHLWIHTEVSTAGFPCDHLEAGNDPGPANRAFILRPQPGDRTYTAYVTKGEDGPRAAGIDVTFGVGIYRLAIPETRVLGTEAPTVIESNGRTWRLDDVLDSGPSEYDVDTSQGDVLLGVAYVGATGMTVSWRGAPADGGWGGIGKSSEPQGPGTLFPGIPLLAGDHAVDLHLDGPDADTRLLVYRPE